MKKRILVVGLIFAGAFAAGAQTNMLVVSTNAITVVAGNTSSFTVRLSDQPTNDVAVTVTRTSGNTSVIVLSGANLTFTSNNFSTAQTVTITAPTTAPNSSAMLTISAEGFTSQTVTATVTGGSSGGGGFSGEAAFQINIKGEIALDEDDTFTTVKFGTGAITGGLRLVLIVDTEENQISLVTATADSVVEVLACSTRCAFVSSGQFDANLCYPSLPIINDDLAAFGNGDMQLRGKIGADPDTGDATSISARIFGVFNDTINGNDTEPNMLMKATLKSKGISFSADEIGWTGDECSFFDCDF